MPLDPDRLALVRPMDDGGYTAQCPVCAASGGDSRGVHLRLFPNGAFACVAHPGDGFHRRQIWAQAGLAADPNRPWLKVATSRPPPRLDQAVAEIEEQRSRIFASPWPPGEILADSPARIPRLPADQAASLLHLYRPADVVWIGFLCDSGQAYHARNFRPVREWIASEKLPPAPRVSTCTFQPGSISRCQERVARRRFLVVESDDLDLPAQGAVARWLIQKGLRLRAVVDSRGRSLHAWFDLPGKRDLEQLAIQLPALGIDRSFLNPVQPYRLPGWRRPDNGLCPRLLYLDPNS